MSGAAVSPDRGWRPEREVEIVAGTPPGGGLDRTARALVATIETQGLLTVPVKVVNIAGAGGRNAWDYVARRAGDPHVLAISSPNLTTDRLVGIASFDHADFTPLAILYTEYIAFVARADSAIRQAGDLVRRLATNAGAVTIALSTALGNPNHIAVAKVIRHAGGAVTAPRIRVFDSALDAVGDVVAGNADIGAVTAASIVPALAAGSVRALAVSAPARLAEPFDAVPTWVEHAADCVIGAWRGVSGPRGLAATHVDFWEAVLAAAASSASWRAELARHGWADSYLSGRALREHLERETAEMSRVLDELGLRK